MNFKYLLIIIGLVLIAVGTMLWINRPVKFLSPISTNNVLSAQTKSTKQIIGFLPFWSLKDMTLEKLEGVDLVYYFSVLVKENGEFDKTDPGWNKLGFLEKFNRKFGLTIACMDNDKIAAVISSPTRRKKVITNSLALNSHINLDFEYVGSPPDYLVKQYTQFVEEFAATAHKQGGSLSVDTYADASVKNRLYDIEAIGKSADYIIVMAYDFSRPSSDMAGAVAPLFGKNKYGYDVYTTVLDYLKKIPAGKFVLGIPFYGYEWAVIDSKPNTFALNNYYSGLSTYKRTNQTIIDYNPTVHFDDLTKTPWFSYFDKDSRVWHQVWFENERSLGLKLDLVNQADLAGVAIWALGYEGPDITLLQMIKDKIK